MFENYLKVALRNLLRHKGYSAINIVGLAVGLAACIVILLWVRHHQSFDIFHADADRIYKIINNQTFIGQSPQIVGVTAAPDGPSLKKDYPEVVEYCRLREAGTAPVVFNVQQYFIPDVLSADSSFFKIFNFEPVYGDIKSALSAPDCIVLTEEIAKKIFGDRDPLGETLTCWGDKELKVTGVIKRYPDNSHFQFNALISFDVLYESWMDNYSNNCLSTYLLLQEGVDPQSLKAKFPQFIDKYIHDLSTNYTFDLQSLRDIHLHSAHIYYQMNQNAIDGKYVYIFSAAALFVLIIACINFMNLSTARSASRAREIGLRKVIGANRSQLILQFTFESIILSCCAMLFALVLIELSLPYLNHFFNNAFVFYSSIDWIFLLELGVVALIVGVLSGIYPAFFLSSFQPVKVLKGALHSNDSGLGLRRALIVMQFSISIILIICTLFVGRQVNYLRNKDMGFDKEHVITAPLRGAISSKFEIIQNELLQNPAITDVTASNFRIGESLDNLSLTYEGIGEEIWVSDFMAVDYDFIPFYGLKLVAGRNFSRQLVSDTCQTFIINETLAKKIGWTPDNAVGRKFGFAWGKEGRVIGVLKDFNFYSLQHEIEPLALYNDPAALKIASIKVKSDAVAAGLKFIESNGQSTHRINNSLTPFWTRI